MDIEALRSFVAFVETGSFTQAARQTFRTQSAISMQMKKLESDTGQVLFQKQGRNLRLTDQGRLLSSYARRILAMHDEALGELGSGSAHSPLRIGCPDDYAESVLPQLVVLLRKLLPQLSLRVHSDCSTELRRMLESGLIDMAILTRAPGQEEGYLLCHDSGVWVHGGYPELLERPALPLVLYEADCKFHSSAIDGMEKLQRPYELICATSSATTIKALLKKGVGISAMARSTMSKGIVPVFAEVSPAKIELPALPSVDIVLQLSTSPHPLLGASMAVKLCQMFQNSSFKNIDRPITD